MFDDEYYLAEIARVVSERIYKMENIGSNLEKEEDIEDDRKFFMVDGILDEDAWVSAWPDYPCPNCGNGGVPKGVFCICGCKGMIELEY